MTTTITEERRAEIVERCQKTMFVRLTNEMVLAAVSREGGWSREQLALLGVEWPPVAGWKAKAVGQRLAGSVVASFILLRDAHLPPLPSDEA